MHTVFIQTGLCLGSCYLVVSCCLCFSVVSLTVVMVYFCEARCDPAILNKLYLLTYSLQSGQAAEWLQGWCPDLNTEHTPLCGACGWQMVGFGWIGCVSPQGLSAQYLQYVGVPGATREGRRGTLDGAEAGCTPRNKQAPQQDKIFWGNIMPWEVWYISYL